MDEKMDGGRSGYIMMIDGWMKKWVHNDDRWMDEEVGT
jgi:hypothetical protein